MMMPPRLLRFAWLQALILAVSVRAADWPLPATTPAAAGFSAARLETLHKNLGQLVDTGKFSGYIVMIARDGKIVDWHPYGWQDIASKTPMQPDAIVAIHSMSKIVTTTAVLILLEEGKLKLSDPVEKYLPALKDRKVLIGGTADAPVLVPAARPITIHDLLTHTAGYYYDETWSADSPVAIELMQRAKVRDATSLDDFVQRVAQLPLHQQPGVKFRYGIHLDLLGAIVEKISGQRLDRFFADRIFTPLEMRDTGFWVPAEKRNRMATLYEHDGSGKLSPVVVPQPDAQHGLLSGGSGLYSTAADYVRFAQMLLNGGQLDGVRLLSPKTVELMIQNHLAHLADPHPFARPEMGFGLGVRMITDLGASPTLGSPGMFGWDGAACTIVQMDPQEHTVAILLAQNFPFNQDDIFATFQNGYYSAIER